LGPRQNQGNSGRHRPEVGAEVDHVGDDEQAHEGIQKPDRVMAPHIGGETLPCHTPDIRADHLDRAHQGVGQQQRPDQAVAELSARLRIGGNSARIIVGSAGDEARAEYVGKPRPVRLLNLVGGWTLYCSQSQASLSGSAIRS
jgi:hypothetical protein